jgi:hypothetical protein
MPPAKKPTRQPAAKPRASKEAKGKPITAAALSSVAIATTSTSTVSANVIVAKGFEEERNDEMSPLIKKAGKIAKNFAKITANIAAFETEMLYKYLGQTYELYEEVKQHKYSDTYFDQLRYYLKSKGIKTNKNTSDISLLIRLIFVVKPKTAHLYSRAIEAAQEAKIKPDAFIAYVGKEGGLEKLRISQIEQDKAKLYREALKKGTELAWRYLKAMEMQPLATAHIPRGKVLPTVPNGYVITVSTAFAVPRNPSNLVELRMLTCLPTDKDTEAFVINAIAKNFAKNLEAAEKMVEKLEGNDTQALEDD